MSCVCESHAVFLKITRTPPPPPTPPHIVCDTVCLFCLWVGRGEDIDRAKGVIYLYFFYLKIKLYV